MINNTKKAIELVSKCLDDLKVLEAEEEEEESAIQTLSKKIDDLSQIITKIKEVLV